MLIPKYKLRLIIANLARGNECKRLVDLAAETVAQILDDVDDTPVHSVAAKKAWPGLARAALREFLWVAIAGASEQNCPGLIDLDRIWQEVDGPENVA